MVGSDHFPGIHKDEENPSSTSLENWLNCCSDVKEIADAKIHSFSEDSVAEIIRKE